jgi:hypothetical protein
MKTIIKMDKKKDDVTCFVVFRMTTGHFSTLLPLFFTINVAELPEKLNFSKLRQIQNGI